VQRPAKPVEDGSGSSKKGVWGQQPHLFPLHNIVVSATNQKYGKIRPVHGCPVCNQNEGVFGENNCLGPSAVGIDA
jgi:hypothetical protein